MKEPFYRVDQARARENDYQEIGTCAAYIDTITGQGIVIFSAADAVG
ncbi:hypothetical protein [Paenibacillus sp. sgz500958]